MATDFERVVACLADALDRPDIPGIVTAHTSIADDLGIDSLGMISFLMRIEEEFDVEIDFERLQLSDLKSVDAFQAFVRKGRTCVE